MYSFSDTYYVWAACDHGTYSNPGTQVGTLNMDVGAVLQTDLL